MFFLKTGARLRPWALIALICFVSLAFAGTKIQYIAPNHSFNQSGNSAFLSRPQAGEPVEIARDFLEENKAALQLNDEDLAEVTVADAFASEDTGTTHIHLAQRYQGIELFNLRTSIHVTSDGAVMSAASNFYPNLAQITRGQVLLNEVEAAKAAAQALGLEFKEELSVRIQGTGPDRVGSLSDGGILSRDITARLVYVPIAEKMARLSWRFEMEPKDGRHFWNVCVDAESGRLLYQGDYVIHDSFATPDPCAEVNSGSFTETKQAHKQAQKQAPDASKMNPDSYEVYEIPKEYPNDGPRTIVTNPADPTYSPFGWHDTNGIAGAEFTITRGNNANAYADRDGNNSPDPGTQPDGGAGLDFTGSLVTINPAQQPNTYIPAAVTNLFYWNNIIHDVFGHYGFTEAAGNFQAMNYSGNGAGGDFVLAEAQDEADLGSRNNAFFGTPPDGVSGRMEMYLWNTSSPERDGDFSSSIIVHEYGHGISNRGTGGPNNVSCLGNAEQMGEGWSDFFAIALTAKDTDEGITPRGMGTWALNQPPDGAGIRPARYSTDMGVNNYTYASLGSVGGSHGVGFVWCTMLWEVYWALVEEHGFNPNIYDDYTTGGNNLALRLVMEGILLQPCSPGFVDGRDAIILADQNLTGGANRCLIWEAFAKRGLGATASQGSANSTSDGTANFDSPLNCQLLNTDSTDSVCAPTDGIFAVALGIGFNAPVTLAVENLPAGASASFAMNPVISVPNATRLTVSGTENLADGSYNFNITANDGVSSVSQTVTLVVYHDSPASPELSAPADAANNVSRMPLLMWIEGVDPGCTSMDDYNQKLPSFGEDENVLGIIRCLNQVIAIGLNRAVSASAEYTVEVDDDPGFGSIDLTTTTTENEFQVSTSLLPLTTYYWRVRGSNDCGDSSYSSVWSFETL